MHQIFGSVSFHLLEVIQLQTTPSTRLGGDLSQTFAFPFNDILNGAIINFSQVPEVVTICSKSEFLAVFWRAFPHASCYRSGTITVEFPMLLCTF